MIRNNKTYYYHADALGSITRMTDQNGNMAQTIRYDSFGNIKSISNPLLIQPYAWTGREFDIESGFYYLRNRYYDPKIGRFISKDPIGFNGGDVNLFRYVGNGPVNFTDPYGLTIEEGRELLNSIAQRLLEKGYTPKQVIDMLKPLSGGTGMGTVIGVSLGAIFLEYVAIGGTVAGAGAIGYGIGYATNKGIEKVLGQPLGAKIYDILHPPPPSNCEK